MREVTQGENKDFSEQEVQERFEAIGARMVEAGLYAEAIEGYKELIRDYPGSRWAANAYLAIAQCYHAVGRDEEELKTLEDVIAEFPDHVVAKRARGAIAALRERSSGAGAADTDLHGAVRRLTRQVERMRQAHARRAWLGALAYLVVLAIVWVAFSASGGVPTGAVDELDQRVTALESAMEAVSGTAASPAATETPERPAPTVTVTPVEPAPGPQPPPAATPEPPPARAPTPPPVRPPTPPPRPTATRTYEVKEGDSLWAIAGRELGDARRAEEIARLNGLEEPYKIRVGDKLKLPARE